MRVNTIGWDIGGAHVKAALVNTDGCCVAVYQQPCPLWKGLDQLRNAVNMILAGMPGGDTVHAITMTGELVDLFANRDAGVVSIINTMRTLLPNTELLVYADKRVSLSLQKLQLNIMKLLLQPIGLPALH